MLWHSQDHVFVYAGGAKSYCILILNIKFCLPLRHKHAPPPRPPMVCFGRLLQSTRDAFFSFATAGSCRVRRKYVFQIFREYWVLTKFQPREILNMLPSSESSWGSKWISCVKSVGHLVPVPLLNLSTGLNCSLISYFWIERCGNDRNLCTIQHSGILPKGTKKNMMNSQLI